jgi:hypothetical protein
MARPPKYTSDEAKPVGLSLRLPRDLYDQAQHHAKMRETTLTQVVIEGLQLRLDTPTDPRDIFVSHDNTAMQELRQMIADEVQAALAAQRVQTPERTPARQGEDTSTTQHYSNAAPVQVSAPEPGHSVVTEPAPTRKGGRPRSRLGQQILVLLAAHPEGLSAEQLRGALTPRKPLGDTLSGMRRLGTVRTEGAGRALRYFALQH